MRLYSLMAFLSISAAAVAKQFPAFRRWPVAFLLTFGAFGPFSAAAAAADGSATDPRKAGAADFAIVIPAILRLLEDNHPAELHTLANTASPISALQRVILISTLRSGFCIDLRLNAMRSNQVRVANWQVRLTALSDAAAASGAQVEALDGGWRVCTRRAGRYELALQHAFSLQPFPVTRQIAAPELPTALGWPVALSLSTP